MGNQKNYRASRSSQSTFRRLERRYLHASLRQLKEVSQDLQAVAKSSGAGGGDCGIALSFDVHSTETLKNRWADLGIELLYQEG